MEQNISDYDKYEYDYEEYWNNPEINRSYENQAEKAALVRLLPEQKTLPSGEESWFMDLGAGFGRLTDCYFNQYKNIILSDYSLENLKKAQEKISSFNPNNPNTFYVAANAYSLPFKPEVIDCLISIRTLHHMEEPEKVVSQISSILKPKGKLILEYANKRHFVEILRALTGKSQMKPFSLMPHRRGEDLFFNFHPRYVKKLLRPDLKIEKILSVSNLRVNKIKKIFPVKFMLFIDLFFQPIFSLLKFGPSIFLLAQKKGNKNETESGYVPSITDMFKCPKCGSTELIILKNEIRCKNCERHFPIIDGIYDFRVE